jgi:hypothetical protein
MPAPFRDQHNPDVRLSRIEKALEKLKRRTPPTATGSLPWCEAFEAGYSIADLNGGTSPNPLSYHFFAGNDSTAFAFVATNSPAAGDGDVHILRSGYYRVRLIVTLGFASFTAAPGYNYDVSVQCWGVDAGSNSFFGPGPSPASVYYSEGAQTIYYSPLAAFPAPHGPSSQGYPSPDPAGDVYLNLVDSSVTWPVQVRCRYNHSLLDADIPHRPSYYLQVLRLGEGNAAAFTG